MNSVSEMWRAIPDRPIYEVSNAGRVRSIDRVVTSSAGATYFRKGKVLATCEDDRGYLGVGLGPDGKRFKVHRLVAALFIGPKPDECEINHKDGNPGNNAVSNLEYVSHKENIRHAFRTGLVKMLGERHVRAKLTEEQVLHVLALRKSGVGIRAIGRQLGVAYTTIIAILRGKSWSRVTGIRTEAIA